MRGIYKEEVMSKNLEKTYNPKEIETKLYERWCENKYFHAEVDRSKKPLQLLCRHRILRVSCIWDTHLTIHYRIF